MKSAELIIKSHGGGESHRAGGKDWDKTHTPFYHHGISSCCLLCGVSLQPRAIVLS